MKKEPVRSQLPPHSKSAQGISVAKKFFLGVVLSLVTLLTGCVRYDVGINFDTPQSGKIVQHLKLGEQLTTLNQLEVNEWLESIEERSLQLKGRVKRISPQEMEVTIPFGNGKQLVNKFNRFFQPDPENPNKFIKSESDLLPLESEISLQQNNLIFVERNKLNLTVDLRALGVLSNQGKIIVSPGSLVDLKFQLNTPWITRSLAEKNVLGSTVQDNQLIWQLQPGKINQIEVVFWLPSPLGIGAAIIILLMIGGFYLKYKHFPGVPQPVNNTPVPEAK